MSIRAKFLGLVDVIMRIPPLFLLDEILKMNLFDTNNNIVNRTIELSNFTEPFPQGTSSYSPDFYWTWIALLKCIIFLLGKYTCIICKIIKHSKCTKMNI